MKLMGLRGLQENWCSSFPTLTEISMWILNARKIMKWWIKVHLDKESKINTRVKVKLCNFQKQKISVLNSRGTFYDILKSHRSSEETWSFKASLNQLSAKRLIWSPKAQRNTFKVCQVILHIFTKPRKRQQLLILPSATIKYLKLICFFHLNKCRLQDGSYKLER